MICITPNSAITFLCSAFVNSILDPELTHFSGQSLKLQGNNNVSVTTDRGFIIQDQLQSIDVALQFLDGKQQLSANEAQQGRSNASSRNNVERAIEDLKNFTILKSISFENGASCHQIIFMCATYVNKLFKPGVPGFLELFLCGCMHVCVCVCSRGY